MPKNIKSRDTLKNIKLLDKSTSLSTRMKNAFVRTKSSAEETQNTHEASPGDYATDQVQSGTQKAANQTVHQAATGWKSLLRRGKQWLKTTSRKGQRSQASSQYTRPTKGPNHHPSTSMQTVNPSASPPATPLRLESRPSYTAQEVRASKKTGKAAKTADVPAKTVKGASKTLKKTAKGTVKTAQKSVKTAEKTSKAAIKTSKEAARVAQKTAQATAKAAKVAERAARAAAKAAAEAAKAMAKTMALLVKLAFAAIKGLVVLIAAGGWVVILIILVICLIAFIVSSIFSIFFSSEPSPGDGRTINSVIVEIDGEYTDQIDEIIRANEHDLLDMSGAKAGWKEVLAVYTIKTVTDPNNPQEVATITDEKFELLRSVFWEMNVITHSLDTASVEQDVIGEDGLPTGETETVSKTVLRIAVTHKTPPEMAAQYGFNDTQMAQLEELLAPEYNSYWNTLLYGITTVGDGTLVEVAVSQLGNVGGEVYWRWYGFDSHVEWCACFLSWCADVCGYLDAGIILKFSSCVDGAQWFMDRGQWQDRSYKPKTGDIIFFDWNGDGEAQHVGVVESVVGDVINTIEGNTSDSCARRSYQVGCGKIYGFGVLGR